jgi:8-oxo-dGTP pyrophosphatase MutT (NUDIX family)
LIPALLHRAALRIAHGLRKRWWRLCRPRIRGYRVLALDATGCILQVRHSYGSGRWMLPGGGLGRNEDAIAGALRELYEETACILEEAREVAPIVEDLFGAENQVHIVAGRVAGEVRGDGRKVIEARFSLLDHLPQHTASRLHHDIPKWTALYEAHSNAR